MATTGGDVSFKFTADTSGLTAAVKDVARAQESAAATAATAAATARTALEAQRAATVTVTMAEKELIAKTLALEAATRSKAAALGISVGQLRQVEAATQRAATASSGAAASVSNLGGAASTASGGLGKVALAVGSLSSVVALVSPQAGQLVSAMTPLSNVVTQFGARVATYGPVLAGLAPIFATVGAAAFVYTNVMDDYTAAKREATRVTEQFAATMLPLNEALETARAENELLTQAQSAGKEELKEFQALAEIQSGVSAKEAAATATLRAELDTLTKAYAANTEQTHYAGQIQSNRIGKLKEEIGVAGDAARELNELGVANLHLRDALEDRAGGEEKAAKATKASTAVVEENGDAYARATDAALKDMARQDAARMASGKKQLAAFRIQEEASQAARDQVIADAEQKIKAEREWARVLDVVGDKQREQVQMYASTTGSVVGSVSGLWDELLQNRLDGIDTESAAGKKAAMEVWEQQKGLAIASATLQAIVAIAMAWASAPPPANIPAIVTSTVAGAASVAAAVAAPAPKFAAGGFPDERTITAHAGEAILSRQGRAAMGDDAIQAANAGRMDGAPAVSQIVYKHRAFDYFVADHLQLDGSLARTIRRGDRVGQLRRGRG